MSFMQAERVVTLSRNNCKFVIKSFSLAVSVNALPA